MYTNEIDNYLSAIVTDGKSPSVHYMMFSGDSILFQCKKGLADIGRNLELSDATTYNAYSVTKTFTAVAILQLTEKDLLHLDDFAGKYLAEPKFLSKVTIRQLMAHTAGIPNPVPLKWVHLQEEHSAFDRNRYFGKIFSEMNSPKSEPGKKFTYTNLGYVLLGQIIEKVSGMPYSRYVTENIIKKLGAHADDLGFVITENENRARGYQNRHSLMYLLLGFFLDKNKFMDGNEGKWRSFRNFYVHGESYGGLVGTPGTFVKFIRELLSKNGRILSEHSKNLMFTENHTSDGKATGICLSWFTGELVGKRYFTHAGGGGGYYCEIRIYPGQNLGSVIFFNRTGISDERFLDKVDRMFFSGQRLSAANPHS